MKTLITCSVLLATAIAASAVPTPVSGPVAGPGDGLNLRAVQLNSSVVHSLSAAIGVLGSGSAHPNFVSEFNGTALGIDIADGDWGGEITSAHAAVPFSGPDPIFAIQHSGYINITEAGSYTFRSYTDDGFQLKIGGEVISSFTADRAPASTISPSILLGPGLYAIEFIGWEQGGAFVNELSWTTPSSSQFSVPGSQVFFTSIPRSVPDGGATACLLGLAVFGLAAARRRRS